jgi:hypothetical protein
MKDEVLSFVIGQVQSIHSRRKPHNAAGGIATYLVILLVHSASSGRPVPVEVHKKLCLEPLLKYPPSLYGWKKISSSSKRNQKEKLEGKSRDVAEDALTVLLCVRSHVSVGYSSAN